MQVHTDVDSLLSFKNAVITVGTFDGVHRGHQKLIHRINQQARQIHGESVLISFHPHPRSVIHPEDHSLYLLSTQEEKVNLLDKYEVDHLVIAPFTKEFSRLSARDYIEHFLVGRFHPSIIVIGYNHQFGHHRDGNIELLQKLSEQYQFSVVEIGKQLIDDIEVSSTRIRIALQEGDVDTASHLLGHYYSLQGKVVRGNQLGRKLGFPTANISIADQNKLIPSDGIYAVRAFLKNKEYEGALSIGLRPTFDGRHRTIETYLFDFNDDIYDEMLRVELVAWIREEKKFETLDLLVAAMEQDVENIRTSLAAEKKPSLPSD